MSQRVSIITVCFNSAKTIRDTIESVLSQDYRDIEYIVVDGGSKDGTLDIIHEYAQQIDVIISENDRGIYDAMNKGIKQASGEIIGIINSDDVYINSHAVSDLVNAMQRSKVDSVFADLLVVDPEDLNKILRYYDSSYFSPSKFRFGWMPAHPTFFVKKSVYEKVGPYSLEFKISADYEMLIRILWVEKASYAYLQKPVVRMRHGGASSSGLDRRWILNREIIKACKMNGIYTNLFFLVLKVPRKLLGLITKSILPNANH